MPPKKFVVGEAVLANGGVGLRNQSGVKRKKGTKTWLRATRGKNQKKGRRNRRGSVSICGQSPGGGRPFGHRRKEQSGNLGGRRGVLTVNGSH